MAGPYIGFTAILQAEIASVYTPVAAVRDIAGPGLKPTSIDLSSRSSRARVFSAGMYDPGEVTFEILYDPDAPTHSASVAGGLVKLAADGTTCNWKLIFPDTAPAVSATFAGFVSNFSAKAPMDGALTADLTIKITGPITWA